MKLFVISLPRFSRRYKHIQNLLSGFPGLDYEFCGVDGSDPSAYPGRSADNFLQGAVGCTLSHVEAYRKIISQGLSQAMVIEDDVILPGNIVPILDSLSLRIRTWEVVSLYSRTMGTGFYSVFRADVIAGHKLIWPMDARWLRSAAAYVVGAEAAAKIAEGNDPVRYLADDWASFYREGWISGMRLMWPMPIRLRGFESTIEFGQQNSLFGRLRTVIRNVPILDNFRSIRRRYLLSRQEANLVLVDDPSPLALAVERGNCIY